MLPGFSRSRLYAKSLRLATTYYYLQLFHSAFRRFPVREIQVLVAQLAVGRERACYAAR
jgi:hypothetical protein